MEVALDKVQGSGLLGHQYFFNFSRANNTGIFVHLCHPLLLTSTPSDSYWKHKPTSQALREPVEQSHGCLMFMAFTGAGENSG